MGRRWVVLSNTNTPPGCGAHVQRRAAPRPPAFSRLLRSALTPGASTARTTAPSFEESARFCVARPFRARDARLLTTAARAAFFVLSHARSQAAAAIAAGSGAVRGVPPARSVVQLTARCVRSQGEVLGSCRLARSVGLLGARSIPYGAGEGSAGACSRCSLPQRAPQQHHGRLWCAVAAVADARPLRGGVARARGRRLHGRPGWLV